MNFKFPMYFFFLLVIIWKRKCRFLEINKMIYVCQDRSNFLLSIQRSTATQLLHTKLFIQHKFFTEHSFKNEGKINPTISGNNGIIVSHKININLNLSYKTDN